MSDRAPPLYIVSKSVENMFTSDKWCHNADIRVSQGKFRKTRPSKLNSTICHVRSSHRGDCSGKEF